MKKSFREGHEDMMTSSRPTLPIVSSQNICFAPLNLIGEINGGLLIVIYISLCKTIEMLFLGNISYFLFKSSFSFISSLISSVEMSAVLWQRPVTNNHRLGEPPTSGQYNAYHCLGPLALVLYCRKSIFQRMGEGTHRAVAGQWLLCIILPTNRWVIEPMVL